MNIDGFTLSDEAQALLESVQELATMVSDHVHTEVPASQVRAYSHVISTQLKTVLQRAKPSWGDSPDHTASSMQ